MESKFKKSQEDITFEIRGFENEPLVYVRRLAEFLAIPFITKEETNGVVEEMVRFCSFENLSNLKVNKNGVHKFNSQIAINNRDFFRKRQVGDW